MGKSYNKYSIEQRREVVRLKDEGRTSTEIARIANIKIYRTVVSITDEDRKCPSTAIKSILLVQLIKLNNVNPKRIQTRIRKLVDYPTPELQDAIQKYKLKNKKEFKANNVKIINNIVKLYREHPGKCIILDAAEIKQDNILSSSEHLDQEQEVLQESRQISIYQDAPMIAESFQNETFLQSEGSVSEWKFSWDNHNQEQQPKLLFIQ